MSEQSQTKYYKYLWIAFKYMSRPTRERYLDVCLPMVVILFEKSIVDGLMKNLSFKSGIHELL
ncbi:hypothetical protein OX88_26085 [Pseudomonas coronafaciens pv. porri]|nr:hypothetical protein OX88_26085 [Pseudomonas coronafaciens pv. porri]